MTGWRRLTTAISAGVMIQAHPQLDPNIPFGTNLNPSGGPSSGDAVNAGVGRVAHHPLPLVESDPIEHPILSGGRGAPFQQAGSSTPLIFVSGTVMGGARGAPYQLPLRNLSAPVLVPHGADLEGAPVFSGRTAHSPVVAGVVSHPEPAPKDAATGAAPGGARGPPARGMDNYYRDVHLFPQREDLVKVGSLSGSPLTGDSGRFAHNVNGMELDDNGSTRSAYLRGGSLPEGLPLLERMKSALGLTQVPTAQPTPSQPTYLNDKGPLYAPQEKPSMFTNFLNKLTGNNQEGPFARAYMDGLSKPDWSLGQKL